MSWRRCLVASLVRLRNRFAQDDNVRVIAKSFHWFVLDPRKSAAKELIPCLPKFSAYISWGLGASA